MVLDWTWRRRCVNLSRKGKPVNDSREGVFAVHVRRRGEGLQCEPTIFRYPSALVVLKDHRPSLACRALASNRQNARNVQVLTHASRWCIRNSRAFGTSMLESTLVIDTSESRRFELVRFRFIQYLILLR